MLFIILGPGWHEPSPPSPHNCCFCPLPIPTNLIPIPTPFHMWYAHLWLIFCENYVCLSEHVWELACTEDHHDLKIIPTVLDRLKFLLRVWSDIQRWFDDDCIISLHGFWMHSMTGSMLCHLDDMAEHHCIKDKFRSFRNLNFTSPPNWCLLQLFLWYFSVTVIIICRDVFCAATNFVPCEQCIYHRHHHHHHIILKQMKWVSQYK